MQSNLTTRSLVFHLACAFGLGLVCSTYIAAQQPIGPGQPVQGVGQPVQGVGHPVQGVGHPVQGAGQPVQGAGQTESDQRTVPLLSTQQAIEQGIAQAPKQPFEDLNQREQQYLDQVLQVWEQRTAQVNRFECNFKRWEYDPNSHPTAPVKISSGIIKYSKPDKGLFRVDEEKTVSDNSPNPQYQVNQKRPYGSYWICDGAWVHVLDRNEKKAERTELPPEMRGNQIHLSPLPFLFGVKAEEVKRRYWVRPVAPPEGNDDIWIEAFPKWADDAGNYSRVQVVLDRNDVLPKAMFLFLPNWSPANKHREVYEFNDKQVNSLMDKARDVLFLQQFIPTKLPSDWQVIEEPWVPPTQQSPTAVDGQSDRTATAPQGAMPTH